MRDVFSENIKKNGLIENSKATFQKFLDSTLAREDSAPETVRSIPNSGKPASGPLPPPNDPLPPSSLLTKKLLPKEIVYGLASEDSKRKLLTLKLAAEAICDPSFALAGEFEEVLTVFLSLNLNEFEGKQQEQTVSPMIWYGKGLCALFVYSPALFIE